jgi:meiosis-specific transcription factor NDT80
MSGQSSMGAGSGFSSSHDTRMQHFRSPIAPVQISMESAMPSEESRSIDESPCYMYYPGPIYEAQETRYQLPNVTEYAAAKVKHEYGNGASTGYVLPSITNPQEGLGRHCGRWESTVDTKGCFPPALLQQEMNIT